MLRAHQIDASGYILNTILVSSLDAAPGLIDASIGGGPGDRVVDGMPVRAEHIPTMAEYNAPILAALTAIDAKSIRALREGDTVRIAALEAEAAALRATLRKD